MVDALDYEKIRAGAKNLYSQTGKIYCPALSAEITFGAKGFNHLIHKGDGTRRDKEIQTLRFKLLPKALYLAKFTTTYQEYEETLRKVRTPLVKTLERRDAIVKFWGLIAIVDNWKIKVVIRQVGSGGQKHFWSIIPGWVTSYHRDMKLFATAKGNPLKD